MLSNSNHIPIYCVLMNHLVHNICDLVCGFNQNTIQYKEHHSKQQTNKTATVVFEVNCEGLEAY